MLWTNEDAQNGNEKKGKSTFKKILKGILYIFGGLFALVIIVGIFSDSDTATTNSNDTKQTVQAEKSAEKTEEAVTDNNISAELYRDLTKKSDGKVGRAPDFVVSPEEIAQEFRENRLAAEKEYKNKLVQVTGKIYIISTDFSKDPAIYFYAPYYDTECHFRKSSLDSLLSLKEGDMVTIQGVFDNLGFNINLENCEVVSGNGRYSSGDLFFEVTGGDNAGTQYYYDAAAVSIDGDIATVDKVSTYPEGELSNVINNKIGGAIVYLDRTIKLNLKEKKFKCTHYIAMSPEGVDADEECDSGWKKIKKDSPVFHLLKAVQLRN